MIKRADANICATIKRKIEDFQKTGNDSLMEIEAAQKLLPFLRKNLYDLDTIDSLKEQIASERTDRFGSFLKELILNEQKITRSLLEGISPKGIKKVTFGLPFFPFTYFGIEKDYEFLLISGIKTNALYKKDDDPLMNETERKLCEYERRMGVYISDDYEIKIENMKCFLELFGEYIDYYKDHITFDLDPSFDYFTVYNSLMVKMALYIFYMATGMDYDENTFNTIFHQYLQMMTLKKTSSTETLSDLMFSMYEYNEDIEAMNASLLETIHKGPATYEVSKTTLNLLRGQIRFNAQANENCVHTAHELSELLKTRNFFRLSEKKQEEYFEKLPGLVVTKVNTVEEMIESIAKYADRSQKTSEQFASLASKISKDGIETVSYNAPIICLFKPDSEFDNFYLTLTAIKKNANEKKTEDISLDSYQISLFEDECRMSEYISDDYRINANFITEFTNTFFRYLDTFFKRATLALSEEYDYEYIKESLLLSVVLYVAYRELGVRFDEKGRSAIRKSIESLSWKEGITPGGIAHLAYRQIYNAYEEIHKRVLEKERSMQPESKDPNSLQTYVQNGRVVHYCEADLFAHLLDENEVNADMRADYEAQMKLLADEEAHREYEKRLEFCRLAVFDEEEAKLYAKYKDDPSCHKTISSIDVAISMFMEATDEDRLLLFDEFADAFDELRKRALVDKENRHVVFYVKNGDSKPLILDSILKIKKCPIEQAIETLESIVSGDIDDCHEIDLPDHRSIKCCGRQFKVFYMNVGLMTIIIDGGTDKRTLTKVMYITDREDFKSFLNACTNGDFNNNADEIICFIREKSSKLMKFKKN